jgi:hypothetical protein
MIRVDGFYIYTGGRNLRKLADLKKETLYSDAQLILYVAKGWLEAVISGRSVFHIKTSWAKGNALLHRRLDIGKAVAIKLEILDQRAMAHAHVEIGVQIEPEAGKPVAVGAAAAADDGAALEHRDFHSGTREVSSKRQPVVTGADDNTIETRHAAPG